MSKADFDALAQFRYQLRRFLRFSEDVTRRGGITPLQYLLLLQIKGFPGREWATVVELAERLQAKHHGVVALISRCELAGLVVRKASRSDMRSVEVELTRKGEQCLVKLARLHRAELLSPQGGFEVPDLTALDPRQASGKEARMLMTHEVENAKLNLFQAIVEQAPDAIIFADRSGAIRVWNRGAETVFGYSAAEILGCNLDVIIPEQLRSAHWEGFRRAIDTGQTKYGNRVLTTRSVHKNGARLYLDMSFGLVSDATGAVLGALAVARDCTARQLKEKP